MLEVHERVVYIRALLAAAEDLANNTIAEFVQQVQAYPTLGITTLSFDALVADCIKKILSVTAYHQGTSTNFQARISELVDYLNNPQGKSRYKEVLRAEEEAVR